MRTIRAVLGLSAVLVIGFTGGIATSTTSFDDTLCLRYDSLASTDDVDRTIRLRPRAGRCESTVRVRGSVGRRGETLRLADADADPTPTRRRRSS